MKDSAGNDITVSERSSVGKCEKCGEEHGARHLPCPQYRKPAKSNIPATFRVPYRRGFPNYV